MADDINQELYEAIEDTLTKYGEILVATIKEQLLDNKNLASGTLYNSVVFQIIHNNEIANIEILAEDYFKYIDQGRKPGSKAPPLFDIVKWIESRRLDVLGTDYARTGLKGVQRKSIRNKAIALVQKNHAQDVVRRAWIIAKSIGLKGIKPLNALAKANSLYTDRLFIEVEQVIADKRVQIIAKEFEESFNNVGIKTSTTYN